MLEVREFNLSCNLQNPVRADFQPFIADTRKYNKNTKKWAKNSPNPYPKMNFKNSQNLCATIYL